MKRWVVVAALIALEPIAATAPALADEAPSVAGDSRRIEARGERRLGKVERPTLKGRAGEQARAARSGRISMQIPVRLRVLLEAKIERRIAKNLAQARGLRREAIGLLTAFVAESRPQARELPEALLRLGELEWEDARDGFLVAFERWEKKPAEQRGVPPSPNYEKARSRFARVLREHTSFRQYDLALYIDGFLATEEGKHDEALARFNQILARFPRSRFVPDAHMVRAEYEFTKDLPDYRVAHAEYEKVLTYKDSDLYEIALFKSAWCLWRLGSTDEAARRFLVVFRSTEDAGQAARRRRAELDELQAEALKNLVAVFVEDEKNTADDMYRFLVRAGGERFAGRIVQALAAALYEQAHYERGIEAYRLLTKLQPTDPRAYQWGLAIAQGRSTMELWSELAKEYQSLIERYTVPPAGSKVPPSTWTRIQTPATLKAAEFAIEGQLRQDAVSLHAKAQADKTSRAQFEAAVKLYGTYLSRFPRTPEAYEIRFNQAEIYFYHLGDPVRASDGYLGAVELNPKGPLSRDALYNALAALESAREREFEQAKQAGRKPQETATDKKLTQAMELYVKTFPEDEAVPELLFRQGKLYYDYGVYDPAVRQWVLLLEKYPESNLSVGAGELILDSFNKSQDYRNIETWARRLKKAPPFQASEQQSKLDGLIVQAVFKQGEQLGAQGKHAEAAQAYLRAASEFPGDKRVAQAAVNATVASRKAGDLTTLEAAVRLLVERHRNQPEAAEGVWVAATTYQGVGLFSEAAGYHAKIAEGWPKHAHHRDAAYNAVLLYTAVSDHDKAIKSGNQYKKYYPRGEETDEVVFLMGKAHEKAQRWKDAEGLYAQYARSARRASSRVEALVRLAAVRIRLGDQKGADAALDRAIETHKLHQRNLDEDGKYFAAKARYMQAERVLAAFDAVKVEGDISTLKGRLRKKSDLLKRAADAFLQTAEMGVAEWTTASLYQVGFTYESFARALLQSPAPSGLSAEQKEAYSMQIEEFVIPVEERSLEAYENGWLKAVELGIFNEWTAKMREALGRLNTELYPPLKEVGFEVRSKTSAALPPLIQSLRRSDDGRSQKFLLPVAAIKEAGSAPNGQPEKGAPGIKGQRPQATPKGAPR